MWHSSLALALAASAIGVQANSLKDIKHIVLFMQENRAFDHYFGTMAGVRNFADPNVHVNGNQTVFEQDIGSTKNGVTTLKPWHINYQGGKVSSKTQCMGAGDNGWTTMHSAYNGGKGNQWITAEGTGASLAYFQRDDIPTQFDIAEGWTVADMSHQSVLGATDPNRIMWMSGSLNIPGSPTNPDGKGGMILDNNASPGCDYGNVNCFPFTWKTFPEYLEDAGISWQVWQDLDNFEDNMLAYFEQYQTAANGSALRTKGNSYPTLDKFYEACAQGTLPQISYIVGPQELSEHPPNMPIDGAWLQRKVVEAVTSSPAFENTALIISYDEQGGWYDHVVPEVAPEGTAGEWFNDPYNTPSVPIPMGPGPREARMIISPWTRGGNVFTEPVDHTSDQQFVEQWAKANGYKVHNDGITQWRRDHMSDLTNAFDFSHSDTSVPSITEVRTPKPRPDRTSGNLTLGSLNGPWVGPSDCLYDPTAQAVIPYGKDNVNQDMSKLVEEGYKRVRGKLTEGRFLTFETNGLALANVFGQLATYQLASNGHKDKSQRWILHSVDGSVYSNSFYLQSAQDGKYIASSNTMSSDKSKAITVAFDYQANGSKYKIRATKGVFTGSIFQHSVYAVNFHN